MREITYSQAIREALTEEMEHNPNIILLGEDIGIYGGVFKVTDGLLDRFGPRKVEAFLLLFAAAGAFTFAQSQSLAGLILGRALIGFGVSACLMAAFKAYTLWFQSDQWPLVNGFQMAAGGMGALAATAPVEAALGLTDWRGVDTRASKGGCGDYDGTTGTPTPTSTPTETPTRTPTPTDTPTDTLAGRLTACSRF